MRQTTYVGIIALAFLPWQSHGQSRTQKPEFEVASIRENKSGDPSYSNFPLGPGPQFDANGGLLMAKSMPLLQFIVFAYKPDMFQIQEFRSKLPEWARTSRFDIESRASSSPTKDEMRLMMQSLLEERFHMAVHRETREEPAYAVQLAKPGVLGPRIKPHPADDPDCAKTAFAKTAAGAYSVACGASASIVPEMPGDFAMAGYNVTMEGIAPALGGAANLTDRRIVDSTRLTGKFDFTLEFAPETPLSAEPRCEGRPRAGRTFVHRGGKKTAWIQAGSPKTPNRSDRDRPHRAPHRELTSVLRHGGINLFGPGEDAAR